MSDFLILSLIFSAIADSYHVALVRYFVAIDIANEPWKLLQFCLISTCRTVLSLKGISRF